MSFISPRDTCDSVVIFTGSVPLRLISKLIILQCDPGFNFWIGTELKADYSETASQKRFKPHYLCDLALSSVMSTINGKWHSKEIKSHHAFSSWSNWHADHTCTSEVTSLIPRICLSATQFKTTLLFKLNPM